MVTRYRRTASTIARTCGAEGAGRDRRARRRVGRRHPDCAPGDLVLPHQLDRLHVGARAHVLRRRRPAGRARRLHAPVFRALRAICLRRAPRPHHAAATAAPTARCRVRGSRRLPRSTGWTATAPTLVGMTGMPEAGARRASSASTMRRCASSSIMRRARRQRVAGVDGKHCQRARSRDGSVRTLIRHVVPLVSSAAARADAATAVARRPAQPEAGHDDP